MVDFQQYSLAMIIFYENSFSIGNLGTCFLLLCNLVARYETKNVLTQMHKTLCGKGIWVFFFFLVKHGIILANLLTFLQNAVHQLSDEPSQMCLGPTSHPTMPIATWNENYYFVNPFTILYIFSIYWACTNTRHTCIIIQGWTLALAMASSNF